MNAGKGNVGECNIQGVGGGRRRRLKIKREENGKTGRKEEEGVGGGRGRRVERGIVMVEEE